MGISKELARKATVRNNAEIQLNNWNNSKALKGLPDLLCQAVLKGTKE